MSGNLYRCIDQVRKDNNDLPAADGRLLSDVVTREWTLRPQLVSLACKKVGGGLRGSELGLEVFRQKYDEAADDRHFATDAKTRHDIHRVCHQTPNCRRKI